MTDFFLPAVLGLVALAYIFMPMIAGASKRSIRAVNYVPGIEEVDLDHDLGKIDDEEWTQKRATLEQVARSSQLPPTNIERLIWNFRRARRVDIAAEAEVLIARNRKKTKS